MKIIKFGAYMDIELNATKKAWNDRAQSNNNKSRAKIRINSHVSVLIWNS